MAVTQEVVLQILIFCENDVMRKKIILGPVILKDKRILIGVIIYDIEGLPEVCSKISGYREFIDNTNVSYDNIMKFNRVGFVKI